MKLGKQVIKLVEDELTSLSEIDLKKFWKDLQENIFTFSKSNTGLFDDGVEIKFNTIPMTGDNEEHYSSADFSKEFVKNPKDFIKDTNLLCYSPKDLVSIILNDYTLDRESTEEEDDQAFEYFLKHLKGSQLFFVEKNVEVEGENEKGKKFSVELDIKAEIKIKNFKYDANKDELTVTDYDIVTLEVES